MRLFRCQLHLAQTLRTVAFAIGHQRHQQYAVEIAARLRHTNPGIGESVQRIHFGVLPLRLLLAATKLAGLAYRARLPAATMLAASSEERREGKVGVGTVRFRGSTNK